MVLQFFSFCCEQLTQCCLGGKVKKVHQWLSSSVRNGPQNETEKHGNYDLYII